MSESQGVLTSKDYNVKILNLITATGQTLDLRGIFMELQIYQDLYSSVMSGDIVINDANDIFNNFSFCGTEYIKISIDKQSMDLPLEKIFRVYKVSNRTPIKNSTQVYTLHFCSDEMIVSNATKISKSYKGFKVSDIIYDVLINHLKVDPSRINSFEPTAGTFDYVVPFKRPFEVIQWCVARAYDLAPKFCYFFYESSFGYSFQSLQTLFKQKPYKTLKFDTKTINMEPANNRDSIDKFTILNDYDALSSTSNGGYASRLLGVDVFYQNFKEYNYSLDIAEKQGQLLNKYKTVNVLKHMDGNTNMTAYSSHFTTYVQINDTASERENAINKWMQPRALHLAILNSFRFKAVLPGDIAMKVGDVVEFQFPKLNAADESGKQFDEYRTAKYLVTAVNHKFKEDVFETIAEFSSDSFADQIPAAKDITSIIKKKN